MPIIKFWNKTKLSVMKIILYRTGLRYGQFFGYVADGIFNSWEEVNAAGRPEYVMANNNNKIQPGDVRYVDINGDGKNQ